MSIAGYTRPLVMGEDLTADVALLRGAGATRIVEEPDTQTRAGLSAWLEVAGDGDSLVVVDLERLGQVSRSIGSLLEMRARGVTFRCLSAPEVDLTDESVVAVLRALDVVRRRTISATTKAGQVGRPVGRPEVLDADGVAMAVELRRAGRSMAHIGRVLGVSTSTVQRVLSLHSPRP